MTAKDYKNMIAIALTKFNHSNGCSRSPATWYEDLPIADKAGLLDELQRLIDEYKTAVDAGGNEISVDCEMAFNFLDLITDEDK